MSQQAMEACPSFNECGANLCPEDSDIAKRTWYIDEAICTRLEFRKLGFIKRQKKLNKKRSPSFIDHLFSYQELVDTAPVKRVLTEEQKERLTARLKQYQFEKKVG